jgi:hypothetical protein
MMPSTRSAKGPSLHANFRHRGTRRAAPRRADGARADAAGAAPQPADTAADPVVAIVDGTPIRRSEMLATQRQLPAQFQQMPLEAIFPILLERMIDAKLISVAGRNAGCRTIPTSSHASPPTRNASSRRST